METNNSTTTLEYEEITNEQGKLTAEQGKDGVFNSVLNEMSMIYGKKNHDYGNSFGKTYAEFGLIAPVVRMNDKMERIKQLVKSKAMVNESIRDTLIDLAVYSVLTIIEMDRESKQGA